MTDRNWGNVYKRLGARPIINAAGNQTVLGGSILSPAVKKAMEEASASYVEMEELLEKSGEHIASLLGVEAAYVTSGCYSALVLCSAAVMTGNDPDKRAQLPDTTGMNDEILLQRTQRYGFDRAFTVPGGKLNYVGDDNGTTAEQMEQAIGPNTAAVAYLVYPDQGKAMPLEQVVEIAHSHNLPVISDAAAQIYPLDYFRRNAKSADLVCFGGKYFNAPHSAGFACGRKDLIEAVTAHGFIGPRPIGRGMKLDRQEIIGLVTAIDEWFAMDHEKRSKEQDARYDSITQELEGIQNVSTKIVRIKSHMLSTLHVIIDTETLGAQQVVRELDEGTPRIKVGAASSDTITINAYTLNEGHEYIIARALKSLLTNYYETHRER
ncbi:MAG: aminotransferase class V-fold PLP-dependent enzyme [Chloroflexi bacterium]|nr:aminotransferase class V-fold PLP-dependent enzyme [Chloroflexota bacterium]